MSVDTREQPATARPARDAAPPATAEPTFQDVDQLIESLRSMMILAKNRHRASEQSSEHGRVSVLYILAKQGPMRASALAKDCMLDLSTVSRHLRALEDEGHVARSADPDDKRAFQVGLTERGHDFMQEFWRHRVASVLSSLSASRWSADDVHTLTTLMHRFVRDTEGCL